MKIAIEAQRIYRQEKHGMDLAAIELIRALQKIDRVNEYFILVKPGKDNSVLKETENFHIVEIPATSYPVWEQKLLPARLKRIAPDILHCTSDTAPLHPGVPLVLTLHDILYMKQKNLKSGSLYQKMGNTYRKWLVPKIINKCEHIITVSNFERGEIIEAFPQVKDKITTVYNAYSRHFKVITESENLKHFKEKYNLPDHFILYLGNTHPNKNIRNVLKAIKLLSRYEQTKIPLVIPDITHDFLDKILKEVNADELVDNICLTGYLPNEKLVYLYNLATIFIYFPSYDSSGMPILESMACGTPVIAPNKTALPEISGGVVEIVAPEEEARGIALAVRKLICNEDTYEYFIHNGLERVKSFSWDISARQVLNLYQEIYNKLRLYVSS